MLRRNMAVIMEKSYELETIERTVINTLLEMRFRQENKELRDLVGRLTCSGVIPHAEIVKECRAEGGIGREQF